MMEKAFTRLTNAERRLFLAGLAFKIVLAATLGSNFLITLFSPFVAYFVNSGFENPYAYFLEAGQPNAFPYPAAMLYLLALPQLFVPSAIDAAHPLALLAFRLPLLVADLTIFFVLRTWLPRKSSRSLIYLYWLSPVLIYITYVHGQLDVVPIGLLFASMFFLFRDHLLAAGVFVGLALAAKTNVLLIYPLFFLFLAAGRQTLPSYGKLLFSSIGIFLLVNHRYLGDPAFNAMVFSNAEQNKLFLSSFTLNDATFYVVPASWLLLMVLGAKSGLQNRDVFITFAGFAFGVVLLLVPPQNGWYYWILPFLAYLFAREEHITKGIFWNLQIAYLLYFLVIPTSDYLQVFQPLLGSVPPLGAFHDRMADAGIDTDLVTGLSFTFLQFSLLVSCVAIFNSGVQRYRSQKLTGKPFLIGIGGNSGVGKSTLSQALKALFTDRNITTLTGDDQHRWQRGDKNWQEFTHLDPKANHLHSEAKTLQRLLDGQTIFRRNYDHETGRFTEETEHKPARLTLLEGLHPFFLQEQRDLFDLKIFISPKDELALHWKLCRDSARRSYSHEQVLEQVERRREDYERYIATQGEYADIVIRCQLVEPIRNIGDVQETPEIYYELDLKNSLHVEPVFELVKTIPGITVAHSYADTERQTLRLSGTALDEDLVKLQQHFDKRLQEIGVFRPKWPGSLFGVVLLFVVTCIYDKAEHARQ